MSQNTTASERVGFVGVGRMGSAMLKCVLDKGYHAALCDPDEKATAPFVASHPELVRVARTPREAAQGADVIEVVVNTNEQLLDACLASEGVLAGAQRGSIVLIHSTVSHDTLHQLGKAAEDCGVHVLDAPVSGARGQDSIPNLAVMVGGDAAAFERAEPIMKTYGSWVKRLGPLGSGLDAKLAINMYRYLCMAAGQEATSFAESTGVAEYVPQLVAHTEANRYVGNKARLAAYGQFPDQKRKKDAELAQKDLHAAIGRAAQFDLVLPSAELAVGLMHRLWGTKP